MFQLWKNILKLDRRLDLVSDHLDPNRRTAQNVYYKTPNTRKCLNSSTPKFIKSKNLKNSINVCTIKRYKVFQYMYLVSLSVAGTFYVVVVCCLLFLT